MSKKGEEILRKRKEAKQKKLLFVLGPIFLLLMVWQGPGYLKMLTGGSAEPTAVTSTPTATGATPDPGSAAPPSTAVLDPSAVPAAPPAAGASHFLIPINHSPRTPDSSSPSDGS